MRSLAALTIVVATAATALACPRGARCVTAVPPRAQLVQAPRTALIAPTARTLALTVDQAPRRAATRAHWNDLPTRTRAMVPSVLEALRTKVAQHLPTYRGRNGMSFAMSPIVVSSEAFDSTPCLGISGGF